MDYIILFTALLPVAALCYYIYKKDYLEPEPPGQIFKALLFGSLSLIPALILAYSFGVLGLYTEPVVTAWDSITNSFWGAAIPEELMKLMLLWLFLRKNKHFDSYMDGIVYAACVSLGFAGPENIAYLFATENWLSTGIARAVLSVPGHFCDGILMGYFYSKVHFTENPSRRDMTMVILGPVLAHGIYDSLLFGAQTVPEWIGVLLVLSVPVFCLIVWRYCHKKIALHLEKDRRIMAETLPPPLPAIHPADAPLIPSLPQQGEIVPPPLPDYYRVHVPDSERIYAHKKHWVATLLGIFLGWLGAHKFYNGSWGWGLIYLFSFFALPGYSLILGLIEGIIYLCKAESYHNNYNRRPPAPFKW